MKNVPPTGRTCSTQPSDVYGVVIYSTHSADHLLRTVTEQPRAKTSKAADNRQATAIARIE
jgi:hypothetical protein